MDRLKAVAKSPAQDRREIQWLRIEPPVVWRAEPPPSAPAQNHPSDQLFLCSYRSPNDI